MRSTLRSRRLTILANRGELGGGEVMLLQVADAARSLGLDTLVVAPQHPGETASAARDRGHPVVTLPAHDRRGYLRALRSWRSDHHDLLWCNGLLPALATAGRRGRVVHLHQVPRGAQQAAAAVSRVGARAVVVPSESMGRTVRHDVVLPNWTAEIAPRAARPVDRPRVIGYLGRLQTDKGVDVLARAVRRLLDEGRDVELLVAGDAAFADPVDAARVDAALDGLGDRVRAVGRVPRERFFADVDLAVFPSVWNEPFGLVVAEAMGFGIPFVVSDAGALAEVAGPDHPWVAHAGDSDDLAAVVRRALAADPAPAVAAARARWEQEFSPEAGTARLASVLRGVGCDVPVTVSEATR